ncbi:prephenate dehydratase [Kocuria palustris]|uniref:prephenate dehydratase n=1 Tax=Kocuria palustris TaxID=71999 RepID=UPI00045E8005|nr:prephenate dehydratase [Kocuria palustris]MBM7823372.1 prephenate dehydratase [Kocuria palustris]
MSIAFLGPAGTFTESALRQIEPDPAHHLPVASVPAALAAVRDGRAASAVVPIENSVEGGVTATLDALAEGTELRICAEMLVPIRFALVALRPMELSQVRAVATHSHAWAQVRGWVQENMPEVEYIPASSTAAGALGLLASGEAAGYDAAICSPAILAAHPELTVLADDIGDNRAAVTRFVQVAEPGEQLPERTGSDRTTLVIPLWSDRAGALLEILEQFSTRGVNLSRIESRPTGASLGDYFFSVDLDGHILDERVSEAVVGLRRICPTTRFLGSYPRAEQGVTEVEGRHTDGAFRQARDWVQQLREGR